jgi:hypothetical protein
MILQLIRGATVEWNLKTVFGELPRNEEKASILFAQRDIITSLAGVSFGLLIAALAIIPDLISIYLRLWAQKRRGVQHNPCGLLAAYPPPVPFNYPRMVAR